MDIKNRFVQVSALLKLRSIIGPAAGLGHLRNGACLPDSLLLIVRAIVSRRARQVVEFGSGASTLAIAAALRKTGGGPLVSVEHDPDFARALEKRIRDNGLGDYVDLRVVGLRDCESRLGFPAFQSYDLSNLRVAWDIAFIDGPIMKRFGAATRLVPLEWCVQGLTQRGLIFMDDGKRAAEQAVANAARALWPQLDVTFVPTRKGLFQFSRPAGAKTHRPEDR